MTCLKLFLSMLALLVARGGSVVQTNTGPVQGKMVASGKVEAFLGIPYAEPPIGPLRFSKPIPKKSWQDIYDATRLPPACIQVKMKDTPYAPDPDYMSEDCLYLNLWVPKSKSSGEPKTIMLFIHGGGFMTGSSNMPVYNGANLAEYGDVIVVTINYRVGSLGFLTDFTNDAPGSVGLYDQVMAIEWMKENAKHFNGNPENIVLFGESAGAWSVSLHQISPLSRNLFKRAILQSGSILNPVYDDNNAELERINQVYADLVGCKFGEETLANSRKDVFDCLRKVPAENFSKVDPEVFMKPFKFPIPRVGNDFLPQNTIDAFRRGTFKDSEVLLGITRDEGTLLLTNQRPDLFDQFGENDVASMFNETMAYNTIKSMIANGDPSDVDKIIRSYLNDVNDETKYTYLKAASDAVGDFIITCGKIFQAQIQSLRSNPVYFYMFDYLSTASPLPEWMGVTHAHELPFVFGNPVYKNFTEYEMKLTRDIMDMWVFFSKTGNPNVLDWSRYTYQHPNYLIIGKSYSVGLRPDHYRCERWRDLYRSIIDDDLIEALKQKSYKQVRNKEEM